MDLLRKHWHAKRGQLHTRVLKSILRRDAAEVFLIEGHTDAVGSDVDNLSLRRAEAVAVILSDRFDVPAEI